MRRLKETLCIRHFEGPSLLVGFMGCASRDEVLKAERIRFDSRRGCNTIDGRKTTEARLVIKPGRYVDRGRHYTHSLAETAAARRGQLFFTVQTWSEGLRLVAEAQLLWKERERHQRATARAAKRPRSKAKLGELPAVLRNRIEFASTGCWLWKGLPRKDSEKYGKLRYQGRTWAAHRLIYCLLGGEIPPGIMLRHKCDNRACVNPAHLLPGAAHQNVWDMINRGRSGLARW